MLPLFIQVIYRYDVSNFMSHTSSSSTFSTLWQYCLSSSLHVSTGTYLHSRRCCFSQTGLSDFFFTLVADLPGLILAVFGVTVFLCLLWTSLHLKLTDLFRLKMTVLFFHREGEYVGKFFAIPVDIGLTNLHLNLPRNIVAVLGWFPFAYHSLRTISIVLCRFIPLAVKFNRIRACHIINNFLLHEAVRCFHIRTLVVVLSCHIDFVSCVANSIFTSETSLDLVRFFQSLVVNCFYKVAYQFIDIKTNTFDVCFDYTCAVVEFHWCTVFLILSPTSCFSIRLALILEYNLLDHVAVGVLVYSISANISLPNIRVVLLSRRWGWILGRWR